MMGLFLRTYDGKALITGAIELPTTGLVTYFHGPSELTKASSLH